MAVGRKTGGRKKGTLNRCTAKLKELAAELPVGDSPLDFLTAVYRNPELPLDVRLDAAGKAAPYMHPRLAAINHGGQIGMRQLTHEEWLASLN